MEFFNYWLLVLKIFLKFCFIQAHKNKSTGSWTEFWHTLKWRSSFNIKVLVCVPLRFKRNAASLFNSNTKMFISRTTFLRNVDVSNWKVTLTENSAWYHCFHLAISTDFVQIRYTLFKLSKYVRYCSVSRNISKIFLHIMYGIMHFLVMLTSEYLKFGQSHWMYRRSINVHVWRFAIAERCIV